MASNPYNSYYQEQAGTGIAGFQGIKYQKGKGFPFRNILSRVLYPLMRYLGKKGLETAVTTGTDILAGQSPKEAIKSHLKSAAKGVAGDAIARGQTFLQTGKGRKRRRRSAKHTPTKKRRVNRKRRTSRKRSSVSIKKRKRKVKHSIFD